jgi:hypothetical protein
VTTLATGGQKQRRGSHYQDVSQLFYLLFRLIDHPDLVAAIESIEDATIYYEVSDNTGPKQITEYVQCKKREQKRGGPAYAGSNDEDPWIAGKYNLGDLREWTVPEREGISPIKLLQAEADSFYTALVFGEVARSLDDFVPEKLRGLLPIRYPAAATRRGFPVAYRHQKDPINSPNSLLSTDDERQKIPADARKKIRLVPTVSPKELGFMCLIMLGDQSFYKVSMHKVEPVFNKLLRLVIEAATIQGKLHGGEMLKIISSGRLERGLWKAAEVELGKNSQKCSDISRGETPSWADLEGSLYAHRPEFDRAWDAISQPGAFIAINGAVGTGKTTLCKYLMHRFLKASPNHQAYYLQLTSGIPLSDELNFLAQNIKTKTLFIIDDEHLAGDEIRTLIEAFVDFKTSGNAIAQLVISSKINYGRTEALAQGHTAKELRQAFHIPLPNNSIETVEQVISEMRRKVSLTSSLTDKEIASLSSGVIGVGLLIAQSAHDLAGDKALEAIFKRKNLRAAFAKWVMHYLPSLGSKVDFETEIAPIFVLSAFGLPVPGGFSDQIDALCAAGFLEPYEEGADLSFRATSLNLAFIFQTQFESNHFNILSDYIARFPQYLPLALVKVGGWRESVGTLRALAEEKMGVIGQTIRNQSYPLPLSRITSIFQAIRSASRGLSIKLFKYWVLPAGSPNKWFFSDVIMMTRTTSELTGFLNILHRIDQDVGVLKRMAEAQLMPKQGKEILLRFLQPSCRLDQIAACLHRLKPFSEVFTLHLYQELKKSDEYVNKIEETQAGERGLSVMLRFCEELKTVDRKGSYEHLEKYLPPGRIIDAVLIKSDTLNPISLFLLRMHRLHPRWAAEILAALWNDHQHRLEEMLRGERDLDSFTQDIYSFSKVNRLIAIRIAFKTFDHLAVLLRDENKYSIAGAKIETFRKYVSQSIAKQLCESIQKEKLLTSIKSERRFVDTVGKFLFDLSRSSPYAAMWFEQRLDYNYFFTVARAPRLRDVAITVRGFLVAASWDRRQILRDRMLHDRALINLFRDRWSKAGTLSEIGFCLIALTSTPLSKDEIERLLNFANRSELSDDLLGRFKKSNNILHVTNGLYGAAKIDARLAQKALKIYTDKVEPRTRSSEDQNKSEKEAERNEKPDARFRANINLVEVGCLLHIASAINLKDARRLVALLDHAELIRMSAEELNLGRLTVFIGGLHQASRKYALDILNRICSDDLWKEQYEQNEEVENLVHYARLLRKLSRSKSTEFLNFLFVNYPGEIQEYLRIQANLLLISNWLRLLSNAGEEVAQAYMAKVAGLLMEAAEQDTRLRHLLEATEALMEAGFIGEARSLSNRILEEIDQVHSILSLRDCIVVLNKAAHIERKLGKPNFVAQLMDGLENRQVVEFIRYDPQIILSAFSFYLFSATPALSSGVRTAVLNEQAFIIESAKREPNSTTKAISLMLAKAIVEDVFEVLGAVAWSQTQPWELGLVAVFFSVIYPNYEKRLPIGFDADSEEWEQFLLSNLNDHAGNLEFALTLYLARFTGMRQDMVANLQAEAHQRDEEELSSTTSWLLKHNDVKSLKDFTYYIWALLKETILRPTYLPWEADIEDNARRIALDQPYIRDMSALITT